MPFIEKAFIVEREGLKSPPIRGYIHSAGFESTFKGSAEAAARYLSRTLEWIQSSQSVVAQVMRDSDYGIAVAWGNGREQRPRDILSGDRMDLFLYSDIDRWPGNPDIVNVNTHGTHIVRTIKEGGFCGDVAILLGREEAWRREQPDLTTYVANPPDISDLIA